MSSISVVELSPVRAADALLTEHAHNPEWLDAFSAALDRRRHGRDLERILEVWGVSQSEAGRRFGVSRQAVAKWLTTGVPADRMAAIADLSAATDLLVRYVKRDRIPAVVRRTAVGLAGNSLLDLLGSGQTQEVLAACRRMFDFAMTQA